jgi:hypothetical protein
MSIRIIVLDKIKQKIQAYFRGTVPPPPASYSTEDTSLSNCSDKKDYKHGTWFRKASVNKIS